MNHVSAHDLGALSFEEYAKMNGCTVAYARLTFWQYETAFVQDIHAMNTMYSLPTPERPVIPTSERLENYRKVLLEELGELDLVRAKVLLISKEDAGWSVEDQELFDSQMNDQASREKIEQFQELSLEEQKLDIMADLADFNCDIQVYAASENCKHGYPNNACMHIVMSSNFSKLGADGKPILDERGKFMKGPNYWKPEPKLKELLKGCTLDPSETTTEIEGVKYQ